MRWLTVEIRTQLGCRWNSHRVCFERVGSRTGEHFVVRSLPGCAVIKAGESGKFNAARLTFYQVLVEQQRELRIAHPDWKKYGR